LKEALRLSLHYKIKSVVMCPVVVHLTDEFIS